MFYSGEAFITREEIFDVPFTAHLYFLLLPLVSVKKKSLSLYLSIYLSIFVSLSLSLCSSRFLFFVCFPAVHSGLRDQTQNSYHTKIAVRTSRDKFQHPQLSALHVSWRHVSAHVSARDFFARLRQFKQRCMTFFRKKHLQGRAFHCQ